jgi:hypothetical protein
MNGKDHREPGDAPREPDDPRNLSDAFRQLGIDDPAEGIALLGDNNEQAALVLRLARLAEKNTDPIGHRIGRPAEREVSLLAQDYLDLNVAALMAVDLTIESLSASAAELADAARLVSSVPPAMRGEMALSVASTVSRVASFHYPQVRRGLEATYVLDALEAEEHRTLRCVRPHWLPPLDAELLRRAGYRHPEVVLEHAIRNLHLLPERIGPGASLAGVVEEGETMLLARDLAEQLQSGHSPANTRPRPKRWSGVGKVLSGASLAAGNVAAGIAAVTGTWDLMGEGATGLALLGSTGTGVQMIFEGIGALKGE